MIIPSQFNQYNRNKKIILSSKEQYHCCYCEVELVRDKKDKKNPNTITIDHKISRNDGGKNSMDNLITSCSRCNNLKGSKYSYAEFKSKVKNVEDREKLYLETSNDYKIAKEKRKQRRENKAIYNLVILFVVLNSIKTNEDHK